jgi:Rhamnan synthesis protein F
MNMEHNILPVNNPAKDSITVLIHIYYPGSWKIIRDKCMFLLQKATNVIITVCHEDVIKEITWDNATILQVTNVGKDIGGKLVSMKYYLTFCQRTEYLVFLHDKISPQSLNADFWLDKLYEIFEENKLMKMLKTFGKRKKVGITGAKLFLKNEYVKYQKRFNTTNHSILLRLMNKFSLRCKSHNYIGGTIFMARSEIFSRFFSWHSPLEIRESLETGNVLDLDKGTNTHSWERLLCFIASAQGYKVTGI